MSTYKAFFKKMTRFLKPLFMFSVLSLVVRECFNLRRNLSAADLATAFERLSWPSLVCLIVLGLLMILPMIGYDIILNRLLHNTLSWSYIVRTSWSVNTINNFLGFGGLINTGLRIEYYQEDHDAKTMLKAISKILIFFLSGLSVFSALSLGLVWQSSLTGLLTRYWPILLLGALYFPGMWLLTRFGHRWTFLDDFTPRLTLSLVMVSSLEWVGVITSFLAAGWALGLGFRPWMVIPLFVTSIIIGMVSMIPGGLGSFDLMMLTGLTSLGYSQELVVAWLLVYRLIYYVIPFLIGVAIFIRELGSQLNARYHDLPRSLFMTLCQRGAIWMSYLLGIFMILSATVPEQLQRIHWLTRINPIQANFIWQFPAICLGLGFILIGRALQGRSRRAWSVSLSWLLLTLAYLNLHDFSLYSNLYLFIMTGLILAIRPVLSARQFIYSLKGLSMDGLILLATMILYLYFMPHHWPLPLGTGAYRDTLPALGTSWLYHFVSLSLLALAYAALYRYLRRPVSDPQKSGLYQTFDDGRLQAFLQVYPGNDTTGLIFLQDKFLYWYSDEGHDRVLLPYSLYHDKLVVMGAPLGEPELFASAIQALTDEAAQWSYSVIFYEVDEALTMLLHDFGFDFMKFGQNASVDLTSFKLTGKHNKGLKATMNSLTHQGYQFDIVNPPHSDSLLLDLQRISDHWLHQRREKGFSVGFFEPSYLNRAPLALLKNSDQVVVAFANLMPNYQSKRLSIDLMRYDDSLAAKGSMDFLFVNLMLYAQDQGYQSFDLGMSPLADVGRVTNSFLNERFAYLIFEYSHRFYSFEGLHQYKQKFKPQWTNRYLCYQRNSWLFTSLLAILQLTLQSRSLAPLKNSPRLLSYIHIIERPR